MEAEINSATKGILEHLKRHRDLCKAFLELLDRKSKLEENQISTLYRKISANTARVNQNRGVPGMESEIERLNQTIHAVILQKKKKNRPLLTFLHRILKRWFINNEEIPL